MTINQPESVETRLSRLETFFANVGETVAAQSRAIDILTENINNLAVQAAQDREQAAQDRQLAAQDREQTAIKISQLTENINNLAVQAAQDREQAAQDRQQAAQDRQQIILEISQLSETIDVLVANISQLTENFNNFSDQTDRRLIDLALQAAQDREQAAHDRQQAAIALQAWQAEIQRIWEYLLQQRGNGRQGA